MLLLPLPSNALTSPHAAQAGQEIQSSAEALDTKVKLLIARLSPRERDVLRRLVEGTRAPAIAVDLGISHHTVRNHLKSIFRKLGVNSQLALVSAFRGTEI